MLCLSESFPKCAFLFVFCLRVSSYSSIGCLESLRSILLVCVLYIRVILILSVRAFCVRVFDFLVFFLSYGRGDYCVLYAFLYFSPVFFLPVCFFGCSFMYYIYIYIHNGVRFWVGVGHRYIYSTPVLGSSGLLTVAFCPRFLFTIFSKASNFSLGGAHNILIFKFSSSLLLKCRENG